MQILTGYLILRNYSFLRWYNDGIIIMFFERESVGGGRTAIKTTKKRESVTSKDIY